MLKEFGCLKKCIYRMFEFYFSAEAKFQMWFHMGFVRKFRLRLHRQILLMAAWPRAFALRGKIGRILQITRCLSLRLTLSVCKALMTVCDLIHMEHAQVWTEPDRRSLTLPKGGNFLRRKILANLSVNLQDKNPGILPPSPDRTWAAKFFLFCRREIKPNEWKVSCTAI